MCYSYYFKWCIFLSAGAFMDAINSMEFDYVASGHYANVIHPSADQINKPSVLELSKDMVSKLDTHLLILCSYSFVFLLI